MAEGRRLAKAPSGARRRIIGLSVGLAAFVLTLAIWFVGTFGNFGAGTVPSDDAIQTYFDRNRAEFEDLRALLDTVSSPTFEVSHGFVTSRMGQFWRRRDGWESRDGVESIATRAVEEALRLRPGQLKSILRLMDALRIEQSLLSRGHGDHFIQLSLGGSTNWSRTKYICFIPDLPAAADVYDALVPNTDEHEPRAGKRLLRRLSDSGWYVLSTP